MRTEAEYKVMTEGALAFYLRSPGQIPEKLTEAMEYSLMAGGKRLRPVLLLAACEMAEGSPEEALPYACALEMIHTYSLIHDDLPGMDNDDLRRGRPTNHKVFGEGLAILAGDGLLNAAMEICMTASLRRNDFRGLRAAESLIRHAGVTGMIGGQTVDVTMEGSVPTEELVSYIHRHKTSDLIQAPMEMGLILAGCGDAEIEMGRRYGEHLGIAFQIVDDILDVTGDPTLLGKNTGMDGKKLTWVALKGIEAARRDAEIHIREAVGALENLPFEHGFFDELAYRSLDRVF
ncbi:MAG: polyprenyl synthetase family protein [Clostridia bacterium]|nr:polyprenyl synthetase family protein [Clostridia bacterium]